MSHDWEPSATWPLGCRYVRRLIGERVRLRLTPEVRFVHDVAVERGERVLALLEDIRSGEEDRAENPDETARTGRGAVEGEEGIEREGSGNPFLEGVGDAEFDSDDEDGSPQSFFSADMFPDATAADEQIAAARKKEAYRMRTGSPRYRAGRKKKYLKR
jgi:hypothetical protein